MARLVTVEEGVLTPLVSGARAASTRLRSVRWRMRSRDGTSPVGLRILFYHRIADDRDALAIHPAQFREHLAFLASEGHVVVDVVGAWDLLARGDLPQRVIGLSFDDGYVDVAENALPILEKYSFRATVFVVTGALDGTASFSWYKRQPPLLSWADITHLDRNSPLCFEAHSVTHPSLLATTDERAREEIFGSKAALEARIGRPASAFCYPGGLFARRERDLVATAGYRLAVSCEPGVNLPATDRFALRRTQIFPSDDLLDFRAKVGGAHDSPLPIRNLYRRIRYGARTGGSE